MDGHQRRSSNISGKYGLLESTLEEILSFIKPANEDKMKRKRAINELDCVLQSIKSLKGAAVRLFGSYVSNIYTKWGDLDISIEIPNVASGSVPKYRKIIMLQSIMSALIKTGCGRAFNFIPEARVPILKYESRYDNIHCDISIHNHVGQLKSKFLLWITKLDWRFSDLVLLIKEWAKAHKINDAKSGTLNSYSLCLLVIFHFQTCEPAILPPLKEVLGFKNLKDTIGRVPASVIENHMEVSFAAAIAKFKTANTSSLSELLISFFGKFREIKSRSDQYAICTYTGRWEGISSNLLWMLKSHCLTIVDPFEYPENVARAVDPLELINISDAFSSTYFSLQNPYVLCKRSSLLDCLVRPNISTNVPNSKGKSQYSSIGVGNAESDDLFSRLESALRLHGDQPSTSARIHQPAETDNKEFTYLKKKGFLDLT